MKTIVFAVNESKSYFQTWGAPDLKPSVKPPLIVPLVSGGKITLAIDETAHTARGQATDLQFSSDQFQQNLAEHITGNLQAFSVKLPNLNFDYDPTSGQIGTVGGFIQVVPEPDMGGKGQAALYYSGPSALLDANSPSFDISNGLGCGGGLVLEAGVPSTEGQMGPPGTYLIHLEAAVSQEDVDGDGTFEVICPSGLGIPVIIGRSATEVVRVLFGVTGDGGGVGILPNGRIIRIPPWGPPDIILKQIAVGFSEVVRGLALRDIVKDSSDAATRVAIGRLGLELAEKGLKEMLETVRKELSDR